MSALNRFLWSRLGSDVWGEGSWQNSVCALNPEIVILREGEGSARS